MGGLWKHELDWIIAQEQKEQLTVKLSESPTIREARPWFLKDIFKTIMSKLFLHKVIYKIRGRLLKSWRKTGSDGK